MKSVQEKKVTKPLQIRRNKDIISLENRLNGNLTELLGWFIERRSTCIIQELLEEKYKIHVSRMAIWRFSRSSKWRPIIEHGRRELAKHILKIPCANKENRLLVLQKVIEEGLKWSLKSTNQFGKNIYELKLGAVTEAVKAAKEEVEPNKNGKGVNVTSIIFNFGNRDSLLSPAEASLIPHQRG